MADMNSPLDELRDENERTKGGIEVGHAILLVFTIGLLLMTGFKTWDFLSVAMPKNWGIVGQIFAAFGLFALDGGVIVWLVLWIKTSATPMQDLLEMGMFVLDAAGVLVANILDSGINDPKMAIPVDLDVIGRWFVPAIVVVNAIAGLVWYIFDHNIITDRKLRREQKNIERQNRESSMAGKILAERGKLLEQKQANAVQKQRLAAIEQGIVIAEQNPDPGNALAGKIAGQIGMQIGNMPTAEPMRRAREFSEPNDSLQERPMSLKMPAESTGGLNGGDGHVPFAKP